MPNSALTFAKRSLSLNKIQYVMGIVLASIGILVLNFGNVLTINVLVNGRVALASVTPLVLGILLFAMPVILLYVYDKNNGVLEYLLSLGWNQGDIFKRYLKAALFLALTIFIAEFTVNVVISVVIGTQVTIILGLVVLAVTAALGFSVVSFVTVAMVAFSSLQKQRVGANSPLALMLGSWIVFHTFLLAYILPFFIGVLIELLIAGVVGALSIVLLILSSRLIRREKNASITEGYA
ncbi:MAG: hypothetical protein ABSB40_00200 [Nitrososphaeria archaeon]